MGQRFDGRYRLIRWFAPNCRISSGHEWSASSPLSEGSSALLVLFRRNFILPLRRVLQMAFAASILWHFHFVELQVVHRQAHHRRALTPRRAITEGVRHIIVGFIGEYWWGGAHDWRTACEDILASISRPTTLYWHFCCHGDASRPLLSRHRMHWAHDSAGRRDT